MKEIKGYIKEVPNLKYLAKRIAKLSAYYSIHPKIKELVDILRSKAKDKRDYVPYFECARKYIVFRYDTRYREQLTHPHIIADKIIKYLKGESSVLPSGDCDDITLFLATLLLGAGFLVRIVGAIDKRRPVGASGYNHIYVQVYDEVLQRWIPLEATSLMLKPGQQASYVIDVFYVYPNFEGTSLTPPEKNVSSPIDDKTLYTIGDTLTKLGNYLKVEAKYKPTRKAKDFFLWIKEKWSLYTFPVVFISGFAIGLSFYSIYKLFKKRR